MSTPESLDWDAKQEDVPSLAETDVLISDELTVRLRALQGRKGRPLPLTRH